MMPKTHQKSDCRKTEKVSKLTYYVDNISIITLSWKALVSRKKFLQRSFIGKDFDS